MKIQSSFTRPQVVPNLYTFICSVDHKGRYFEKFVTKLLTHPHTHHTQINTIEVNGASKLFLVSHILIISYFVLYVERTQRFRPQICSL